MTTSMNMQVYRKVLQGQLTPEQAADRFMADSAATEPVGRPAWMPQWLYIVGVLALAVFFAPLISSRSRRVD